jgi:hypothetical protein
MGFLTPNAPSAPPPPPPLPPAANPPTMASGQAQAAGAAAKARAAAAEGAGMEGTVKTGGEGVAAPSIAKGQLLGQTGTST